MTDPLNEIKARAAAITETDTGPSKVVSIPSANNPKQAALDKFLSALKWDDVNAPLVPPKWLIRNMISEGSTALIAGQSGAGKTYTVLYMAMAMSTGVPFLGRKVDKQCGALIYAPEGEASIPTRLAALRKRENIKTSLPIAYVGDVPDLRKDDGLTAITDQIMTVNGMFLDRFKMPLGAVFFDTAAASFDLADQNDNSEVAKVFGKLNAVIRKVGNGIALIPVHHMGKNIEAGPSGAHGWRANADHVISIIADRDSVTGDCTARGIAMQKNRMGIEGAVCSFDLERVELGTHDDGETWGDLALVPRPDKPVTVPGRAGSANRRASKGNQALEKAFDLAIVDHGENYLVGGGQGPVVRAVRTIPHLRDAFYSFYSSRSDAGEDANTKEIEAKRKAFARAISEVSTKATGFALQDTGEKTMVWRVSGDE